MSSNPEKQYNSCIQKNNQHRSHHRTVYRRNHLLNWVIMSWFSHKQIELSLPWFWLKMYCNMEFEPLASIVIKDLFGTCILHHIIIFKKILFCKIVKSNWFLMNIICNENHDISNSCTIRMFYYLQPYQWWNKTIATILPSKLSNSCWKQF